MKNEKIAVVQRNTILERFAENKLLYYDLSLQHGVTFIVPQFGARLLGPFLPNSVDPLYWINPAFHDSQAFRNLLQTDWNMGGDRFWIAPEIQFLTRDRFDYWGTGFVPTQMDPGNWQVNKHTDDLLTFHSSFTLDAYNLAYGKKELEVEISVKPTADPLRHLLDYSSLISETLFAGYEQTFMLCEKKNDEILSASWNLIQLNPGGLLYIPTTHKAETTDYMEPIDEHYQQSYPHSVRLRITGDRRFKVGFKASQTFGRMAYLNDLDLERSYLIVRHFSNHPSAEYPEEPPETPGRRGDSIFVYNDDGEYGGFGEMECHGRTLGGKSGISTITDHYSLWMYIGKRDHLKMIMLLLLGVDIEGKT